jgi:H+/Cl- antiporter ClcA
MFGEEEVLHMRVGEKRNGPEKRTGARLVVVALVFVLGAAFGCHAAESLWEWHQSCRLHPWGPPSRGLSHYLLAVVWALSGGALGAALAGWDLLAPNESPPAEVGRTGCDEMADDTVRSSRDEPSAAKDPPRD